MSGKSVCLRNEEGSVLIITVLVLVLLVVIGITATRTTTTELQISGNEKVHKIAFYAAEAGVEVGRTILNELKLADSGNWDNLLAANDLVGQTAGITNLNDLIDETADRDVGQASFSLQVRDNNDLDGSTVVDTDNIIVLTSTGTFRRARVDIEAIVRYDGGGDQYAQEHYDSDSSGRAARETTEASNNIRW
jgi:Tfp pilus assembly protein PilX